MLLHACHHHPPHLHCALFHSPSLSLSHTHGTSPAKRCPTLVTSFHGHHALQQALHIASTSAQKGGGVCVETQSLLLAQTHPKNCSSSSVQTHNMVSLSLSQEGMRQRPEREGRASLGRSSRQRPPPQHTLACNTCHKLKPHRANWCHASRHATHTHTHTMCANAHGCFAHVLCCHCAHCAIQQKLLTLVLCAHQNKHNHHHHLCRVSQAN